MIYSLQQIARATGGEISGNSVRCPGPGHSPKDRSLQITLSPTAPDGFLVHSFSPSDDDLKCKDYVRAKLGLPEFKPNGGNGKEPVRQFLDDEALLTKIASDAAPLGFHQTGLWRYRDSTGRHCIFATARYDPDDGGAEKTFRPICRINGCVATKFPIPRPLYGLDRLAARPDDPVLVVEGEKTADAAAELIPMSSSPRRHTKQIGAR
jgi:hypothetical protein